jgi:hypothetical protein
VPLTRPGPPLWFSAASYYSLSAAISTALFFILWGVLLDSGEETPWIGAGIAASVAFAAFVVLREVVIRRRFARMAIEQERLDSTIRIAAAAAAVKQRSKITLERNKSLLGHIRLKSDAAKVLNHVSDAHKEVYELCDRYLSEIAREMASVSPGSPRIAAFRTGTRWVQKVHRFHVFRWAEIESKQIAPGVNPHAEIGERLTAAKRASNVLGTALSYYPNDVDLQESAAAIDELLKKAVIIELTLKGDDIAEHDHFAALDLYRQALDQIPAFDGRAEQEYRSMREDIEAKITGLFPEEAVMGEEISDDDLPKMS